MKSIDFPGSNNVLPTKAGNMSVFIGSGGQIVSRWYLTWREIWHIIRNRAIFVMQYPESVAFPQCTIEFRGLTPDEMAEAEERRKEAELEAKKKAVIEAKNKRNPARVRKLHEVAKEQGIIRQMNSNKKPD